MIRWHHLRRCERCRCQRPLFLLVGGVDVDERHGGTPEDVEAEAAALGHFVVLLGEECSDDLGGAEPAQQHGQHHRSVPVGAQAGQERLDVGKVKGFGQSALLADQPSVAARPPGAEVAEHAA